MSTVDQERTTKSAPLPAVEAEGDGMSARSGNAGEQREDPQNLDQIREILFGRQRAQFQRRFEQLEARLKEDAAKLQKDFEARLESMEKRFELEAKNITSRLEAEVEKRTEALENLSTSLKEKEQALSKTLEKETARVEKVLKDRSEALQADLEKNAARLTSEKASRKDLAAFFSEIAERLSQDA